MKELQTTRHYAMAAHSGQCSHRRLHLWPGSRYSSCGLHREVGYCARCGAIGAVDVERPSDEEFVAATCEYSSVRTELKKSALCYTHKLP
jgi:hypothetical protein